jgi:hypothetical protein
VSLVCQFPCIWRVAYEQLTQVHFLLMMLLFWELAGPYNFSLLFWR